MRSRPPHPGLVAMTLGGLLWAAPLKAAAQGDASCPPDHRDEKGNCRAQPVFTPRRSLPKQEIRITTVPDGAEVQLNGEEVYGINPGTGQRTVRTPMILDRPVKAGTYLLTLKLSDHVDVFERIKIDRYGAQLIKRTFVSWPKLSIRVTGPPVPRNAKVTIDNQQWFGEWSGGAIEPGFHLIEITYDGYTPYSKVKEFKVGQEVEVSTTLTRATGSLEIRTNLIDLPVYRVKRERCERNLVGLVPETAKDLDDELLGRTALTDDKQGVLVKKELKPGAYCVEFRIAELGAFRRLLFIEAARSSTYSFDFKIPSTAPEGIPRIWGPWRWHVDQRECAPDVPGLAATRSATWDMFFTIWKIRTVVQGNLGDLAKRCFRLGLPATLGLPAEQTTSTSQPFATDKDRLAWYAKACKLDLARGCEAAGWMYYTGKVAAVSDDKARDQATPFFTKACRLGLRRACYGPHLIRMDAAVLDPARNYRWVSQKGIQDDDSLVYQPWVTMRGSIHLGPGSAIDGSGRLVFDLPLSVLPYVGAQFGSRRWGLTAGLELGPGIARSEDGAVAVSPAAAGTLKSKWVVKRRFYFDLELRTDNSIAGSFGLRWRAWVGRVGLQATGVPHWDHSYRLPSFEGLKAFFEPLQLIVSFGPVMGRVLQGTTHPTWLPGPFSTRDAPFDDEQ